jgi:hypothetical protein
MKPYARVEAPQYQEEMPLYSQVPSAKELKKYEKRLRKEEKREWKYDHQFGREITPLLTHPDHDFSYGPTLMDQSHDA